MNNFDDIFEPVPQNEDFDKAAWAAKKKAERLQSKIETQLVSAGGRILRRGLLGILKR